MEKDNLLPDVQFCRACGAVGMTCCESAIQRRDTADSLGVLVKRQSEIITRITRELQEARQVIGDLRADAVKPSKSQIYQHTGSSAAMVPSAKPKCDGYWCNGDAHSTGCSVAMRAQE